MRWAYCLARQRHLIHQHACVQVLRVWLPELGGYAILRDEQRLPAMPSLRVLVQPKSSAAHASTSRSGATARPSHAGRASVRAAGTLLHRVTLPPDNSPARRSALPLPLPANNGFFFARKSDPLEFPLRTLPRDITSLDHVLAEL